MQKASSELVICWITAPSMKVGESLAARLVTTKLAACVNIMPQVRSVYSWEGKVNIDDEVLMMAKTKHSLVEKIATLLKNEHPYDVPELISTRIDSGLPSYLEWASSSCADS
ncbi:protein CutA 1 chloroplastic-like protein [Perkinsela sp. CCAP 1560/4]|nr:protein CutA 1 chloroplastic-like protein [Perkinsela sp. CCAP 1560/4]|eukprot:KNH01756.1 protein CutA 1 chloroplastic-like protein [Perkinsela sp. CCAP 1560/4]